ncbi:hypothetical protein JVU11DRAFT_8210 [Chiua virens]|nr:hypothetical protein JVU11DRAFT_8210 [Chiua virens]
MQPRLPWATSILGTGSTIETDTASDQARNRDLLRIQHRSSLVEEDDIDSSKSGEHDELQENDDGMSGELHREMDVDVDVDVDMADEDTMIEDDEDEDVPVESEFIPSIARSTGSRASGSMSRGSSGVPPYNNVGSAASTSSLRISRTDWTTDSSAEVFSRSPSGVPPNSWYPLEPSENKAFSILYVPDASRAMSRSAAERNLSWARREISFEHFEAIKGLTGFVHKYSENRHGVRVNIMEWLWIMLIMNDFDGGDAFDVTFMSWEEFRDIILDPPSHIEGWTNLTQCDCIIGGLDYTIGHSEPNSPYGLDKRSFSMYEAHVTQLGSHTQFWPPIRLTRRVSDKWTTICHLQIIAQSSMRFNFSPHTRILKDGDAIPPDAVLKRSHSECSKHVILPSAPKTKRTWTHLNAITSAGTFWMAQEYVPSLADIGEWRVFIIGGRVMAVMHTRKHSNGEWRGEETSSFCSFDEISKIIRRSPKPVDVADLLRVIVNPQGGDGVVRSQGREQFYTFVRETWKSLVMRETKDTGAKPSLCVFCRLDVGIKIDPSGTSEPQYFVNEVERTPTTSLWLYHFEKTMATFADTFAMVFRQWLMDIRNPYIM